MNPNSPTVVFTNFWDADEIAAVHHFIVDDPQYDKIYKFNLFPSVPVSDDLRGEIPSNYSVRSIALSKPEITEDNAFFALEKNGDIISRLDFFCPKYSMLKQYKRDSNWEVYRQKYRELLVQRKDEV